MYPLVCVCVYLNEISLWKRFIHAHTTPHFNGNHTQFAIHAKQCLTNAPTPYETMATLSILSDLMNTYLYILYCYAFGIRFYLSLNFFFMRINLHVLSMMCSVFLTQRRRWLASQQIKKMKWKCLECWSIVSILRMSGVKVLRTEQYHTHTHTNQLNPLLDLFVACENLHHVF